MAPVRRSSGPPLRSRQPPAALGETDGDTPGAGHLLSLPPEPALEAVVADELHECVLFPRLDGAAKRLGVIVKMLLRSLAETRTQILHPLPIAPSKHLEGAPPLSRPILLATVESLACGLQVPLRPEINERRLDSFLKHGTLVSPN